MLCMYVFIYFEYNHTYITLNICIYTCIYWISDLYWIFTQMLVYIVDAIPFLRMCGMYVSICMYVLRNLP